MFYDDVLAKIKALGEKSSMPERPDSYGKDYKFPEDLTTMTSEEVSGLMSRLGAYRAYVQRQCMIAEIQRELWKDYFSLKIREFIPQVEKTKGMTKTDVKEAAKDVEEARNIKEKIMEVDKVYKMYFNLSLIYTGQIDILSRELTRKKASL